MDAENHTSIIRHQVVEAVRSALRRVVETEELSSNDPALVVVENSVVRSMAELEIKKPTDASAAQDQPQQNEEVNAA